MEVSDFLEQVAYKSEMLIMDDAPTEVWKSKFDDSYLSHVGLECDLKFLADREITQELTHGVGFSPKDGKWYGWSHRAICGFHIGSTCKKGDCHYRASNEDEEIDAAIAFWRDDEFHEKTWVEDVGDGKIEVKWLYNDLTPNEKIRGTVCGTTWNYNPSEFGRGEWTAETLEDAKQMAIDFNKGVS